MKMTDVERKIRAERKLRGISKWPRSEEGFIELKALKNTAHSPIRGFDYSQYLPKGKTPGRWTPKVEHPVRCERGWHVTLMATGWTNMDTGGRAFVCETRGERDQRRYEKGWGTDDMDGESKAAYSQIRLVQELSSEQVRLVQRINVAVRNQRWMVLRGVAA